MNTARAAFVLLTLTTLTALPARASCGCADRPCEAATLESVTVPRPVPAPESPIEFAIVDPRTDVAGGWVPVLLLLLFAIAVSRVLARRNALLRLRPCTAS